MQVGDRVPLDVEAAGNLNGAIAAALRPHCQEQERAGIRVGTKIRARNGAVTVAVSCNRSKGLAAKGGGKKGVAGGQQPTWASLLGSAALMQSVASLEKVRGPSHPPHTPNLASALLLIGALIDCII